jgi:putative ABC transport system permease protein
MGIPLRDGREYTGQDGLYSTPVVIINEAFARKFFPDQNPLGHRINPAMSPDNRPLPMREIVGVAADARSKNLSEAPEPEVYLHLPQCPATSSFSVLLRTTRDAQSIATFVREAAAGVDPAVPIYQVRSVDSYLSSTLTQPRFNGLLLGVFAAVALLLTAIGLYGVMVFSVSQRTQEIGLRLALGARSGEVFKLIVGQGMKLVLLGLVVGVAGALVFSRVIKQLLFGVGPADPLTFVAISLLLLIVALIACYVPARSASKVDPLVALRHE